MSTPITPQAAIVAFKQGAGAGNCASVSVIKAALVKYGFEDTFTTITTTPTGYDVSLRDGTALQITTDEINRVSALSHFEVVQDPAIVDQAHIMYAVMVKNKALQQNSADLTSVINPNDLYLEMDTQLNFGYLGLSALVTSLNNFDLTYLGSLQTYILTNIKHSAFANGANYDEHGTSTPINQFVNEHSTWLTRRFGQRDINGAYILN